MLLKIDRLTKQFGHKIAVDRLSASLSPGIYGLLGANGAGKTTLMRMLCGILYPTSGDVQWNGRSILSLGEAYRDLLGYLPQDFGYYPDFTAEQYLHYIAALKGLDKQQARAKSHELLELVDLSAAARKKIRTFSGGMKQRLGIAQAVINDPCILILDEPTAGLDPKERVRFRNIISHLSADKIVILSTHIVSDVESIAGQILLMKKGQLLMQGTVKELTAHADGCVWICRVKPEDVPDFERRYTIGNVRHEQHEVELRIISEDRPAADAFSVEATLEDLYLYCFSDEHEHHAAGTACAIIN
ncbi:ABC transporter ATP-binding protein [Paenibacillus senegalensis]|uniref:ABC transporter ATP-binding protein n=1 Tax=Paenibacillus senegalensis TaxID=1465766 RepID=UPI000287B521|nr:ABC transporter ATP-binding protein [Paenibacillus senegalensis]